MRREVLQLRLCSIMKRDENHSVRIERIENVKDVRSYVERIDEMIERKRKFFGENEF